MGRMAWPCTSFSTTMGMLVTGSIIRPRIFISTSVKTSLGRCDVLPHQAVRCGSRYADLNVGSQKFIPGGSEIYNSMRTGISRPLVFPPGFPADQNLKGVSDHRRVASRLDFPLPGLQDCQPPPLLLLWYGIIHSLGGCVWPGRILECEHTVVLYFVEQAQGLFKVRLRLARETYDDIRGNCNGPARAANHGNLFEVLFACVGALHFPQDSRRAGLHWQVNVIAEPRLRVDRLNNVGSKIARMGSREPHTPDARHACNSQQ